MMTRMGKFYQLSKSNVHWYMRFIDKPLKVDLGVKTRFLTIPFAFTKEKALVSAKLMFDYQVEDAYQFLSSHQNPIQYLHDLILSHLHDTISRYTTTELLQPQVIQHAQHNIKLMIDAALAQHPLGLIVQKITILQCSMPSELQKELKSLQKVYQETEQLELDEKKKQDTIQHELELYAQQKLEAAQAEHHQIISNAQSDINHFLNLLPYYEKEPKLTVQRLYFDMIESILKHHPKVVFIGKGIDKNTQPAWQISINTLLDKISETKTESLVQNKN